MVEHRLGHRLGHGAASSSLLPGVNTFVLGLRPAGAAVLTPGGPRLLKGNQAPNRWFGAPRLSPSSAATGGLDKTFHIIARTALCSAAAQEAPNTGGAPCDSAELVEGAPA